MARPPHGLDRFQRWMQTVVMHPEGVSAGIASEAARCQIDVRSGQLEEVICRSSKQTSLERLQVYANAYYARLLECLREEFPALVHALGQETFDGFAFGYLQEYPSRSYTLANLGRDFPCFLKETQPADTSSDDGRPTWADFLIELATLERMYSEVFDGPGIEHRRILEAGDLVAFPPNRWRDARLIPVPCLRLLCLRFPVHEYITAVRRDGDASIPDPLTTYLVVTRRDFVVRRCTVSELEYNLLSNLVSGMPLGIAIESTAAGSESNLDNLTSGIQTWFRQWASGAFFQGIELMPNESAKG